MFTTTYIRTCGVLLFFAAILINEEEKMEKKEIKVERIDDITILSFMSQRQV